MYEHAIDAKTWNPSRAFLSQTSHNGIESIVKSWHFADRIVKWLVTIDAQRNFVKPFEALLAKYVIGKRQSVCRYADMESKFLYESG